MSEKKITISIKALPDGDGVEVTVSQGGKSAQSTATAPTGPNWDLAAKRAHVALVAALWHERVPHISTVTKEHAADLWKVWMADPKSAHPGVRFMRKMTNQVWRQHVLLS